jgi:hypothetical protein
MACANVTHASVYITPMDSEMQLGSSHRSSTVLQSCWSLGALCFHGGEQLAE